MEQQNVQEEFTHLHRSVAGMVQRLKRVATELITDAVINWMGREQSARAVPSDIHFIHAT